MFVPLQVKAAEQDTVTLKQENSEVAVSLGMSNAKEEMITAVSVAFQVDTGGSEQAAVDFVFDPGLSSVTEHDYLYDAGTGRMDIYVTSMTNQSLFGDGELNLGHVRITPGDPSQTLQAEVSYVEDSFQTANLSYGNKTPVVSAPEPVKLQVGAGSSGNPPSETAESDKTGENKGSGNKGNKSPKSSSGGDNMSQGLYDEDTRFVNNPADAQKISSDVVKENNSNPAMTDMSQGLAANIGGGRTLSGSGSAGQVKGAKVSVVAPEDGPDSILITKEEGNTGEAGDGQGGLTLSGQGSFTQDGSEGGAGENTDEIKLDKKNGGAVEKKKGGKISKLIIAGASAAFLAVLGIGIFIFMSGKEKSEAVRKEKHAARRKKKPVRKKKRKPAGSDRRKKGKTAPAGKKPVVRKR